MRQGYYKEITKEFDGVGDKMKLAEALASFISEVRREGDREEEGGTKTERGEQGEEGGATETERREGG